MALMAFRNSLRGKRFVLRSSSTMGLLARMKCRCVVPAPKKLQLDCWAPPPHPSLYRPRWLAERSRHRRRARIYHTSCSLACGLFVPLPPHLRGKACAGPGCR